MAGTYELKPITGGQVMFNLKAANGRVILTSERYKGISGAMNGIKSVKTNARVDRRYDRRTSRNGQPYFVLKAANNEIIGSSEAYSSRNAMENGIASVKKNAASRIKEA